MAKEKKKRKREFREQLIVQFQANRDEIIKRIEIRNQLLTFTLVVAGAVLSFGATENAPVSIILIYPILSFFLALSWMHSDVRASELGNYNKHKIEPHLRGLGWESYIRDLKSTEDNRLLTKATEVSASGIFVVSQLVALLLATPRLSFSWAEIRSSIISVSDHILFIVDVILVGLTFIVIRRRRRHLGKGRGAFSEE